MESIQVSLALLRKNYFFTAAESAAAESAGAAATESAEAAAVSATAVVSVAGAASEAAFLQEAKEIATRATANKTNFFIFFFCLNGK
ncbi:MAG: hypothetical protein BGN96_17635 [Bacteroidales bacterium 45-6]|nr:MAG: hypothetical protein BGN96_17635 [Bacteroidales bacterium 45-6]